MEEILIQIFKKLDRIEKLLKDDPNINTITKKEKIKFLEFVYITQQEYDNLCDIYGESKIKSYIEKLNLYIEQNGKDKYKSHKAVILNRLKKDGVQQTQKISQKIKDLEINMTDEEKNNAKEKLQKYKEEFLNDM